MKKIFISLFLLLSVATISYAVPAKTFEQGDYPDQWAFTVDEVAIWCLNGSQLYVVEFEKDQWYALNGPGKAHADKNMAHDDISPIWLEDPETGLKKSLSFWINEGLEVCK